MTKVSDFYSARQWHSTIPYTDFFRPQGVEHVLQLCLPGLLGPAAWPCSAAKIARQLGITEGTVRSHLEDIYTRLQVSNRAAAVVHVFPDGATM